jgi:hypothetical protein
MVRRATELRFGRRNRQNSGDFWAAISWWWEEDHVLVPGRIEERRIATELESAFGPDIVLRTDGRDVITGLSIGATVPSSRLSIFARSVTPTGTWEWEGIIVETESTLHPIRRFLISTLTGAKWKPHESPSLTRTDESSITPYGRLSRRWG